MPTCLEGISYRWSGPLAEILVMGLVAWRLAGLPVLPLPVNSARESRVGSGGS